LFEVIEGSTVIAVDASHYREVPNCGDMNEEISVPGGFGCLNKIRRRSLKITASKQAAAEFQYRTFPVAGRGLVGYLGESDTRSICLPSLLLAKRLIVVAYDLKLRWQWKCKDRLTGPVNHLRPMPNARASGNGHELVAQCAEVVS
jgi:hypothetical protein